MTIDKLYKIIEDRKINLPKNSYITSLFNQGIDRIVQKIGEEATEVVIAAKNDNRAEIISEVADLWFHTLVLLAKLNISPSEIMKELESRKT